MKNPSPTAEKAENRGIPVERGGERSRISFAIRGGFSIKKNGNHVAIEYVETGHPLPKLRMTGGQSWKPEVKRYMAWKAHVVTSFVESLRHSPELYNRVAGRVARGLKPIPSLLEKAHMTVRAYYNNHAHADTENVFGSIADALFENDSKLVGTFDYDIGGKGLPRGMSPGQVIATIEIDPITFSQPDKEPRAHKSSRTNRNVWQKNRTAAPRSPRSPGRTRS